MLLELRPDLSLGAAVLAGIHTFFGFESRAAQHREAAASCGSLRRELEQARSASTVDPTVVTHIRTQWNEVDRNAPAVPDRLHRRCRKEVLALGVRADVRPGREFDTP